MEPPEKPPGDFLPSFSTIDSFSQSVLRSILISTKDSNQLPGDKRADWDYYTTFPDFRNVMQAENTAIRSMLRSQLEYNNIKARLSSTDVAELVEILSDANDTLLERVNIALDEAAGIRREADPLLLEVNQKNINRISGSWNNFNRKQPTEQLITSPSPVKLLAARNVIRPQLKFSKYIDNRDKNPFMPRLVDKPHALKPLSILVEYDGDYEVYSHPYIYEMDRFTPKPPQLAISVAVKPPGVEQSELVMVETVEQLRIAVQELSLEEIIGVDLEHHGYRSYLGITCLIQISSHLKDFLIDPLKLWAELPLLNEIMTNPNIVKVLHGCDSDVEWLQRDFSVYLVNVFDTHQAGKLLGLPRLSLAWLLQHYCGLDVDKKFQLADWRIRPLPQEMVKYARQDTRYLIYLYSRLKNELISKGNESSNLILSCIHQSQDLPKRRYHKPRVHLDSHLDIVRKARASLNNRQIFALKQLYAWRDKIGRTEDESINFVLPNHMLLKIATEVPREMQGILACCNPVPPLVKQNLGVLHQIILSARDKPIQSVDQPDNEMRDQTERIVDIEVLENPLQSPLDLAHFSDSGQLETVVTPVVTLGEKVTRFTFANNNLVKTRPDLSVFGKEKVTRKLKIHKFTSPYQRWNMLKPYLDSIREAEKSSNSESVQQQKEDVRLESIMKHFAKLTEMTPKRPEKKDLIEDDEEEDEEVEELDEEVEPNKPYFSDPNKPYVVAKDKITNFRVGIHDKKGKNGDTNDGNKKGKGGECFKCGEEGHFARECPVQSDDENFTQIKKGKGGECFKCGGEGHFARECQAEGKPTQEKMGKGGECFKCGEEGHFARECPAQGGKKSNDGSEHQLGKKVFKCYKCGEEGHMSRECSKTAEDLKNSKECFKCGEEGHLARDCKKGGQVKGKKRKSEGKVGGTGVKVPKSTASLEFDYTKVNFSKFGKKEFTESEDFDPSKKKGKDMKGGGGKQKQKFKNGGKSFTFKKQ